MTRLPGLLLVTLLAVGVSGCATKREWPFRSEARTSASAEAVLGAAQDVLRRAPFRLDRVDQRAGVITTRPESSTHFFEVWRRDVATARDRWESTVNPLRRWVEVTVLPDDEGGGAATIGVKVIVHKERLSSPDRQFNSSGAAYQFFGDQLPSTTGLVRVTPEHDRWLDAGRDSALEHRLLRAILHRAGGRQAEIAE